MRRAHARQSSSQAGSSSSLASQDGGAHSSGHDTAVSPLVGQQISRVPIVETFSTAQARSFLQKSLAGMGQALARPSSDPPSSGIGIQAKLKIGKPGDKYEQEADRVADQVMKMPEPRVQRQATNEGENEGGSTCVSCYSQVKGPQGAPMLQRQGNEETKEEEGPNVSAKPVEGATLQRQADEEEEKKEPEFSAKPLEGATAQGQADEGKQEEEELEVSGEPMEGGVTLQRQAKEDGEDPVVSAKPVNGMPTLQQKAKEEEEEPDVSAKSLDGVTTQRQTEGEKEEERESEVSAKPAEGAPTLLRQAEEKEKKEERPEAVAGPPEGTIQRQVAEEQEEEGVADQVMSMPEARVQRQGTTGQDSELGKVQNRNDARKRPSRYPGGPGLKNLSGYNVEAPSDHFGRTFGAKARFSRKSISNPKVSPPVGIKAQIDSFSGGGRPMSRTERGFFETRFGWDFSAVKLHTGPSADRLARALNAEAFTSGRDIFLRSGRDALETPRGKKLLAHELAHVVQQGAGKNAPRRDIARTTTRQPVHAVKQASRCPIGAGPINQQQIKTTGTNKTLQRQKTFPSAGYGVHTTGTRRKRAITRSSQLLDKEEIQYGLECVGTSIMYMIQSYGLIPPNMTRKEFEYAFTPVNPKRPFLPSDRRWPIRVGGKVLPGVRPVDLFTKALKGHRTRKVVETIKIHKGKKPWPTMELEPKKVSVAEATLRGYTRFRLAGGKGKWKSSLTVSTIMERMPAILEAFRRQSMEPKYSFMRAYTPVSGRPYTPRRRERWVNAAARLRSGKIGSKYFEEGNTVLVAVNLVWPPVKSLHHWCVIVRNYVAKEPLGSGYLYLYPADDPLGDTVFVMVPFMNEDQWKTKKEGTTQLSFNKKEGRLKYDDKYVRYIIRDKAYCRRGPRLPSGEGCR